MSYQEPSFNLPTTGPDAAVEALEARRLLSLTAPVDAHPAPNHVPPSATEGTAVGLTAATSAPSGAQISYALTDDAGGRFTIDRATGIVTVALAAMLAGPAAHTISVQAAVGAGESAARSFVVGVGNAPVAPAPTDRARVNVASTADGFLTVRSDQGTPLRGGTAFVYESGRRTGKTAYISDPAYYREMRSNGLNAVRLIAFDPYMRSRGHNHTDLDDPNEVAALLSDFDTVVDLASKEGMYVSINYHDVGGYEKEYLTKFWDLVAPRYRDCTHVAYERMNEAVK